MLAAIRRHQRSKGCGVRGVLGAGRECRYS